MHLVNAASDGRATDGQDNDAAERLAEQLDSIAVQIRAVAIMLTRRSQLRGRVPDGPTA